VYSIYKDSYGNMWVGTFAGGVNILSKDINLFDHYKHTSAPNSLNHNNVLSFCESRNGKIWVGTDGGGLNLFDPSTKKFTYYTHDPKNNNSICGNYVLGVCEDSKGNVWVGTWADGITVFNPGSGEYRHFKNKPGDLSSLSSNNAWVIFEDSEKNIWVGTYGGGLNLYDPQKNAFIRFDDSTASSVIKQIYTIAEDEKGNLWLGTDGGGLRVFNKKTKTFTRYVHEEGKNSLSDNRINYIYRDKLGNFWINTMVGLNYFDRKTGHFITYTVEDGLPNNVIYGVAEDNNGHIWISTNRGLSRMDLQTKKFKNYTPADGLQSYEFKGHAVCKTKSGTMYFGGINGFNEFFPENVKEAVYEPPLVLTGLQVLNKKVPIAVDAKDQSPLKKDITETKELTLSYGQSVITFEFASLNYTVAEKKQYAYMLEGFDKAWNEIGTNRTATYTNLDPGNYVFKVKGLNNEGDWSTRTVSVNLTIKPPYWKTWWFKMLCVLVIAAIVVVIFRIRMRSIRKQKTRLENLVNEKTRQLVESTEEEHRARADAELANKELERKNKELEQFAYVASHDMQEPLRTTSSFVELLQKQYHGKLDEKADKYLTYIVQASDRMKVLIKDLLDYSRIGKAESQVKVDCNVVLEETLADLTVVIRETGAEITSDPLPVITGYPTEMKQLFQNLLTNAIKFRKKEVTPKIRITVKKNKNAYEFSFKDNGIGIDKKHSDRIFIIFQRLHSRNEYQGSGIGLAHCKKIVELHGGRIWIDSKPDEGTKFLFTIRA
jgi:signal transduction histidine kinase/ligand-binding sensor domain-containing protein